MGTNALATDPELKLGYIRRASQAAQSARRRGFNLSRFQTSSHRWGAKL